jgi:hypothetical protein
MPTYTTTYSLGKPVVGADEDAWGDTLNASLDSIDDILDGTTPVTGIDINSGTLDGVTIGGTTAGAGTFTTLTANTSITGTLATAAQPNITSVGTLTGLTVSASASLAGASTTADITFGDNDKAIFGAGSDLQIYHSGVASYISDQGTGNLIVLGDNLRLKDASDTDDYLRADQGGDVKIFYAGSEKLATTSTGVDITGTLTSDGLTVQGVSTVEGKSSGFGPNAVFETTGTAKLRLDDLSSTSQNRTFITNNYSRSISGFSADNSSFGVVNIGLQDGFISFDTAASGNNVPSERMRIDSSGNVGIGTSSPNSYSGYTVLTVDNATNGGVVEVSQNDTIKGQFYYDGTLTRLRANVSTALAFDTNDTERMRIDSSGNVGIGTTSPLTGLYSTVAHVSGTSGGLILSSSASTFGIGSVAGVLQFYDSTNAAERMRIDSSGNLLVGKTSTAIGTAGATLWSDGLTDHTRSGEVLRINRLSTDGDIVTFRKDGTTVGSIGSVGGVDLNIGTDTTGLRFYDGSNADGGTGIIVPWNVTANSARDAQMNLGSSTERFRNLYLSGGVYLGGTGSANKLDDYEEGTWTPTITGGFTGSGLGKYTKVGDIVYVTANLYRPADTSSSTEIQIGGWPFTPASLGHWQLLNISMRYTNVDEKIVAGVMIDSSSTYHGKILIFSDSGSDYQYLTHSASTSSYWTFQVSGTYKTA